MTYKSKQIETVEQTFRSNGEKKMSKQKMIKRFGTLAILIGIILSAGIERKIYADDDGGYLGSGTRSGYIGSGFRNDEPPIEDETPESDEAPRWSLQDIFALIFKQ